MGDQLAQQAPALRPVIDLADLGFIEADRHELDQRAAFADHAQRAVAGVHQADRRLNDPPQHHLKVKMAADSDHRLQQGVRPVPGGQDILQADLQFGQQLIQAQLRHQRMCLLIHPQLLQINMRDTASIRPPEVLCTLRTSGQPADGGHRSRRIW